MVTVEDPVLSSQALISVMGCVVYGVVVVPESGGSVVGVEVVFVVAWRSGVVGPSVVAGGRSGSVEVSGDVEGRGRRELVDDSNERGAAFAGFDGGAEKLLVVREEGGGRTGGNEGEVEEGSGEFEVVDASVGGVTVRV